MKYWKTLAMFALMAFVVVSCDDNDNSNDPEPTPEPTANYYPSGDMSYWVYKNHIVESNSGEEAGVASYDSVYVSDVAVDAVNGNKTYTHNSIKDFTEMAGDKKEETTVFRYDADAMELRADLGYLMPASNVVLNIIKEYLGAYLPEETFVKIADFDAPVDTTWKLLMPIEVDTTIKASEFPGLGDIPMVKDLVIEDIKYEIEGKVSPSKNISIDAIDRLCEVSTITHRLSGSAPAGYLGTLNITIDMNIINYYADGIGLVKTEMVPVTVNLIGAEHQLSSGQNSYILRHNVVDDSE
jgi:hypothetical protein